jgi:hypothetical protein
MLLQAVVGGSVAFLVFRMDLLDLGLSDDLEVLVSLISMSIDLDLTNKAIAFLLSVLQITLSTSARALALG